MAENGDAQVGPWERLTTIMSAAQLGQMARPAASADSERGGRMAYGEWRMAGGGWREVVKRLVQANFIRSLRNEVADLHFPYVDIGEVSCIFGRQKSNVVCKLLERLRNDNDAFITGYGVDAENAMRRV